MTQPCSDRLEMLLWHFPVDARVDALPGEGGGEGEARLLLLAEQSISLMRPGQAPRQVTGPAILLLRDPAARISAVAGEMPWQVMLDFQGGRINPLFNALPEVLVLPLAQVPGGPALADLLLAEAGNAYCGRAALLRRLVEALLIQMLREVMESGVVAGGLLAGMSDARLRHALVAMHEAPDEAWTLETLAARAGLSRSQFAQRFREVLGVTPADYLQGWRVSLAQRALRAGHSLKRVALDVGYGSEQALSRAFKARCGVSPRAWLAVART